MKFKSRTVFLAAFLSITAFVAPGQTAPPQNIEQVDQNQVAASRISPFNVKKRLVRRKPKHWFSDWEWWLGETVILGLEAADSYSTVEGLSRCHRCFEENRILGPHPSRYRVVAYTSIGAGLGTSLHILSWKACPGANRRSHVWRIACNAVVPGIAVAYSTKGIIRNSSFTEH